MESFHLFFSLNLGHRIFSHTGNLYRTLQAKKISAKKSTECKIIKGPINPRKRKFPIYSTTHLADGTATEAQDFHPTIC